MHFDERQRQSWAIVHECRSDDANPGRQVRLAPCSIAGPSPGHRGGPFDGGPDPPESGPRGFLQAHPQKLPVKVPRTLQSSIAASPGPIGQDPAYAKPSQPAAPATPRWRPSLDRLAQYLPDAREGHAHHGGDSGAVRRRTLDRPPRDRTRRWSARRYTRNRRVMH